jgi:hypothetical protein
MTDTSDNDLSLLLRRQEAILSDLTAMRDNPRVSTDTMVRLASVIEELRAIHAEMRRANDRPAQTENRQ